MNSNQSETLVWIDMEMSGLNPETDRVLEVATVLTNGELEELAVGPVLVVHQSEELIGSMDEWNTTHHGESGLIDKVRRSVLNEAAVEQQILEFIQGRVPERVSPLCGNSIWQDRRFIAKYMPLLDGYLHYRNIDVSSVKELVRRWYPELPKYEKKKSHTALEDIQESIAELRYYREKVFRPRNQLGL